MRRNSRIGIFEFLLCLFGAGGLFVIASQYLDLKLPRPTISWDEPAKLPVPSHAQRIPNATDAGHSTKIPEIGISDPEVHPASHLATSTLLAQTVVGEAPTASQGTWEVTWEPTVNANNLSPSKLIKEGNTANVSSIEITGTFTPPTSIGAIERVQLYINGNPIRDNGVVKKDISYHFEFHDIPLQTNNYQIHLKTADAKNAEGTAVSNVASPVYVLDARIARLNPESVDSSSLGRSSGPYEVRVRFDTKELSTTEAAALAKLIEVVYMDDPDPNKRKNNIVTGVIWDPPTQQVIAKLPATLYPGEYSLKVSGGAKGLKDRYGNTLAGNVDDDYIVSFVKFGADSTPSSSAGLTSGSGPAVEFPDFVPPRETQNGFNPEDKVETRVSRLYYYRDAHRVAQIINRTAQSYNKAGTDIQHQLADKARKDAQEKTQRRQELERAAVNAAKDARNLEKQLAVKQQSLQTTVDELNRINNPPGGKPPEGQPAVSSEVKASMAALAKSLTASIPHLEAEIRDARTREATANENAIRAESAERLALEEQFNREVASAKEDPDTYAPGRLESVDPVRQVSVSVIGEGVIHLRGPLKGINVIRQMINQIDTPVGQTRIAVHTVQVNGEKADRMEKVADVIQKQIDQSRFLTMQSAEYLRKAVVEVAAQKAEEARHISPGESQLDRDQRYVYAFFGKDFIDELRTMDSEFLHSGNKLLSLHSMDSTSLSSALTLMALAKNSTRHEILLRFEEFCQGSLPLAEQIFVESSLGCCPQKHKALFCKCKQQPVCLLAQNAKFQSLRGFFDAQINDDETMTPLQREFIKLAQIFKSRVITEMELKQRVMERSIIEDRLGNRREELQTEAMREQDAKEALTQATTLRSKQRRQLQLAVISLESELIANNATKEKVDAVETLATNITQSSKENDELKQQEFMAALNELRLKLKLDSSSPWVPKQTRRSLDTLVEPPMNGMNPKDKAKKIQDSISQAQAASKDLKITSDYISGLFRALRSLDNMFLSSDFSNLNTVLADLHSRIREGRNSDTPLPKEFLDLSEKIEKEAAAFKITLADQIDAAELARSSRRPLDHKKFLEMLIADTEDKYVELLEGTRAHTANIDNYIKRLTTALDDDFNVQFYNPTFRKVREASTLWDVHFGQTETTSILANNRQFAKVSPQASMEFDLPKRDILITEAMKDAKAMVDDYGALVNDPSFLALASMKSGQSPASPAAGTTRGASTVRNTLPGLDGQTQEQYLAQNGPGRGQVGAALENLIPDPAIYKFETGTGYEIRPVIQPDGQAVVFDFHYLYTTKIREPVRADEKHLGRVKQHYIDTNVQLSNFELREVSRYVVALKAARTSKGVPALENVPVAGVLFRPLPSQESSLQQNQVLCQATVFPTLFDLMGLRWAPAVTDLDPLRMVEDDFVVRGRNRSLQNRVYDHSSEKVDEFLRIPEGTRRRDLYRSQETIPSQHPSGYEGPGMDLEQSQMQEGYQPNRQNPPTQFTPSQTSEGSSLMLRSGQPTQPGTTIAPYPLRSRISDQKSGGGR